jgi:hypothetical protein
VQSPMTQSEKYDNEKSKAGSQRQSIGKLMS